MKTARLLLASVSAACVLALSAGCAVPGAPGSTVAVSPAQQAINSLNTAYASLNTAVLSADAAVDAGVLKDQNARTARDAFVKTRQGLDAALAALKNAQAAAAASAAASAPK